jgi:hypothetical protein
MRYFIALQVLFDPNTGPILPRFVPQTQTSSEVVSISTGYSTTLSTIQFDPYFLLINTIVPGPSFTALMTHPLVGVVSAIGWFRGSCVIVKF